MTLIEAILAACERHGMPETTFGKAALNDPPFVGQLRRGRNPGGPTMVKVMSFIHQLDGGRVRFRIKSPQPGCVAAKPAKPLPSRPRVRVPTTARVTCEAIMPSAVPVLAEIGAAPVKAAPPLAADPMSGRPGLDAAFAAMERPAPAAREWNWRPHRPPTMIGGGGAGDVP